MTKARAATYAVAYQALNDEQQQAVDQLDGPILVVAGPGTGKTQLLAVRIGRILEQTDAAAENILCLTFSESAAIAMKQRLASLIGPSARDVTVSTYHGFGRALISAYPERFNAETLAAKPADELLLDKLLRQVQSELPYSNPLKNDYYRSDLKSLISGYKRALITPELLEQILASNQSFIDAADKLLCKLLPPDFRLSKSSPAIFDKLLNQSADLSGEQISPSIVPLKKLWLEQLADALEQAAEQNRTTPLRLWKDKWLEKDSAGSFIVASPALMRKQQAFVVVFRKYNALLEKLGLFDYDDMIMLAIKGLADNPDLKQTLQERYLYLQLDEFQDTNEAQLKLVELLADHPVNEGRPNVLAVGDDDQAIYSFQGAHFSHMERFLNLYRQVKLIGLKQNYRSTPGIIKLSGTVRGQINDALTITTKEQVSAAPNDAIETIERVELTKDIEQLAWVSDYIHTQISKRATKASDIAVFAPKHQLLAELIPYLHAAGIAINYEQKNNVLDDRRINELLAAARLTIALKDARKADTLWPQVLSHAYWQLPTSLIWQLSLRAGNEKRPWLDLLLAEKQTTTIALFFIRLNQIADDSSFELMLSYLLGTQDLKLNEPRLASTTSPFYSYYFASLSAQNEQFDASAWRLLGHLSILRAKVKASSEQSLNLAEFIDFCDSYSLAGLKIIDSSPFREAEDAVNLMTAYSAKGQEFETVILLDVVDNVWGHSTRRQSSKIALPANLANVRIDKNSDDEKLRLLFVALSRAKRRLILTSYAESISGRTSEPLGYLAEHHEDGALISPYMENSIQSIKQPKLKMLEQNPSQLSWWSPHLEDLQSVDKRALLSDRLANFHLTATNLNAFTNVMEGGPQRFFIDQILKFPKSQSPRAEYGSAIHITLDWLFKQTRGKNGKPPKLDLVLSQFETQLTKRRLGQLEHKQLLEKGREALSAYYAQVSQLVGPDDQSEYSFSPTIGDNNIRLRGTIDRLIIDRKSKTIRILDFKSGNSYSRFSSSDLKSVHHKRQLYFYKLLLEQTSKFKGFKLDSASIQFVEPDDDGEIKSIELKFDQAEADKFLELIHAVWEKIMGLDFPSTEHYAKNINGIYAFEQDLLTHAKDK